MLIRFLDKDKEIHNIYSVSNLLRRQTPNGDNKVKLTVRKSYGFRTDKAREIALYHVLGKLPEPPLTHGFF